MNKGKWWNLEERNKQKRLKKTNWYKKNGSEAVFFVDATPNRTLAEACSEEFKKAGLRVTVIERTGKTIKKIREKRKAGYKKHKVTTKQTKNTKTK